jgi:hypothetical protein
MTNVECLEISIENNEVYLKNAEKDSSKTARISILGDRIHFNILQQYY